MKSQKDIKKEIEKYNIEGIIDLFNELKYSNSSLTNCNAQELLDFVKKCCKIKKLQAPLQQNKEFIEMIDIPKLKKDFELRLERGCTEIEAFVFVLEEVKSSLIGSKEKCQIMKKPEICRNCNVSFIPERKNQAYCNECIKKLEEEGNYVMEDGND